MGLFANYRSIKSSAAAAFVLAVIQSTNASARDVRPDYPVTHKGALLTSHTVSGYDGYVNGFCKEFNKECVFKTNHPRTLILTPKRWQVMVDVNVGVNHRIKPITDKALYGVEEKWTYPRNAGDCEDFVLLKRAQLLARGFPRSSLLIAGVLAPNKESHAVLVVRTDKGDFVLDNLSPKVRSVIELRDAGYRQMKLLDPTDFSQFVNISGFSTDRGLLVARKPHAQPTVANIPAH